MKRMILAMLGMACWVGAASPAAAIEPIYTGRFSSLAVGGFDPVAYFEAGRPVQGSKQHEIEWMGASWRFANAENLEVFRKDPERYAPQYGGYCAYAVANDTTAPGDPEVWKIVGGKLYLNVSRSIAELWERDIPGYVAKADANWPRLLAE